MSEVKNVEDWTSVVEYSPSGPKHHVLADTDSYRAVLVGIEAGGKIPPHPSTDATYHFLEGTGLMIVDGERYPISAGSTMVVPANAERGMEAETRLAFLGSHGGHGKETSPQHTRSAYNSRRPMWMFGIMALSMLIVMVGLWQIGASPMAMMFSGFGNMGLGVWGTMLLPMLGLLGMFVMMFFMYRTMSGMSRGKGMHDHASMMGKNTNIEAEQTDGEHVTYTIPAISCDGCKETIEKKVRELEGVSSVQVDVDNQQAEIEYEAPATRAGIESYLAEIGYPIVSP